jgi:lysozyme
MQPRHHVSATAVELIKRFEGFRRTAAQLADGRWTIGYGHTRSAREGAHVTESDASALLLYDLQDVTKAINELIFTPLTQNQVDALASFILNIGVESFKSSSVLRRINEGALLQAGCAIEMWRKADFEGERIIVDALVRRRAAEKGLFLTPAEGYVPAPTPVVRPRIDYAVKNGMPQTKAVELDAPLEGDSAAAVRHDAPELEVQEDAAPFPADPSSPTVAAAAAVSARLSAIMSDFDGTAPAEPVAAEQPAPAAEPEPVQETPTAAEPEAAPAAVEPEEAPITHVEPIAAAAPAPAQELSAPIMRLVDPMVEYSEPEGSQSLFDPVTASPPQAREPVRTSPPPLPPYPAEWASRPEPISTDADLFDRGNYAEPSEFEPVDFDAADVEPLKAGYLPLVIMVLVGLAVFAGAIFWVFAARPSIGSMNPTIIGWVVGLIGIAMLASSVYFLLERLGGRDEEDK